MKKNVWNMKNKKKLKNKRKNLNKNLQMKQFKVLKIQSKI